MVLTMEELQTEATYFASYVETSGTCPAVGRTRIQQLQLRLYPCRLQTHMVGTRGSTLPDDGKDLQWRH
jgi:hypothetical protein